MKENLAKTVMAYHTIHKRDHLGWNHGNIYEITRPDKKYKMTLDLRHNQLQMNMENNSSLRPDKKSRSLFFVETINANIELDDEGNFRGYSKREEPDNDTLNGPMEIKVRRNEEFLNDQYTLIYKPSEKGKPTKLTLAGMRFNKYVLTDDQFEDAKKKIKPPETIDGFEIVYALLVENFSARGEDLVK